MVLSTEMERSLDNLVNMAEQHATEVNELVTNIRRLRDILPKQTSEPSSRAEVRNALVHILDGLGTPTHRGTLYEILRADGVTVSGKNPVHNLSSILSQFSEDFHTHGQGVWGLAKWENSPPLRRGNNGDSRDWEITEDPEDYPEMEPAGVSDDPGDLPW